MKLRNSVFIILLVLSIIFQSTTIIGANTQGCCLQPYDDGSLNYILPSTSEYDQSFCDANLPGSLWVDDDCYEGPATAPTAINVDNFNIGYCCDENTNTPLAQGTPYEAEIYEPYCNSLGGHTFQTTPCTQTTREQTYNVSGYVFDQNNNPLNGITIQWLDQQGNVQLETTTTNGYYKFSSVTTGQASFLATAPVGYSLTCSQSSNSEMVTSTITGLNFSMICQENSASCTPNWQTGPWGECVPYTLNGETIMVQFREVIDLNNCSTTEGQPVNINTSNCEGTVSFGDCLNGELDGSEQCDPGTNGQPVFRDLFSDEQTNTPISCKMFGLAPEDQAIGC